NGQTMVHLAALQAAEQVMKQLIRQGFDLNRQDDDGLTPLYFCFSDRKLTILKFLLNAGVPSTVQDKDGETIWHIACVTNWPGVIDALLSQDNTVKSEAVKIVSKNGRTPLAEALFHGHAQIATYLIQRGAHINAQNKSGVTPLMLAALLGQAHVVEILLDNNAGLEIQDMGGKTAATYAAYHGHVEVLGLLRQRRAKFDITDIFGANLLMESVHSGNPKAFLFLLNAGLDPHRKTVLSETAIQRITEQGTSHFQALLLNSPSILLNADKLINFRSKEGLIEVFSNFGFSKRLLLRLSKPQRDEILGKMIGDPACSLLCIGAAGLLKDTLQC
ncbi:ankyrin repeat-containing domain protein, partial [Podospora appendiculata]